MEESTTSTFSASCGQFRHICGRHDVNYGLWIGIGVSTIAALGLALTGIGIYSYGRRKPPPPPLPELAETEATTTMMAAATPKRISSSAPSLLFGKPDGFHYQQQQPGQWHPWFSSGKLKNWIPGLSDNDHGVVDKRIPFRPLARHINRYVDRLNSPPSSPEVTPWLYYFPSGDRADQNSIAPNTEATIRRTIDKELRPYRFRHNLGEMRRNAYEPPPEQFLSRSLLRLLRRVQTKNKWKRIRSQPPLPPPPEVNQKPRPPKALLDAKEKILKVARSKLFGGYQRSNSDRRSVSANMARPKPKPESSRRAPDRSSDGEWPLRDDARTVDAASTDSGRVLTPKPSFDRLPHWVRRENGGNDIRMVELGPMDRRPPPSLFDKIETIWNKELKEDGTIHDGKDLWRFNCNADTKEITVMRIPSRESFMRDPSPAMVHQVMEYITKQYPDSDQPKQKLSGKIRDINREHFRYHYHPENNELEMVRLGRRFRLPTDYSYRMKVPYWYQNYETFEEQTPYWYKFFDWKLHPDS